MSRKSGMEPERPAAPVLVIEDNTEVRQALVALLEAEGYSVIEAVDGVSALKLLRAGEVRPRLLVLGLIMQRPPSPPRHNPEADPPSHSKSTPLNSRHPHHSYA